MSDFRSGPRRVSIHLDGNAFDVTLPSDTPLCALLPALHDVGIDRGADGWTAPLASYLSLVERGPLDSSKTLSELGVADGAALILSEAPVAPVRVHEFDDARVLADLSDSPCPWTPTASRLAALLTIACLAAVVGFSLVPGDSGAPRVLLAAAAVSCVAVAGIRSVPEAAAVLVPTGVTAGVVAATSLPATLIRAELPSTGVVVAVLGVLLVGTAGRWSVLISGAVPQVHHRYNHLVAGGAAATALGVVVAGSGTVDWPMCAFSGTTAAVLLSRALAASSQATRAVLLSAGILCSTVFFEVLLRLGTPTACWTAAAAFGMATPLWLGFGVRSPLDSPGIRRSLAGLEKLAITAALPVAAVALDLYELTRGWVSL